MGHEIQKFPTLKYFFQSFLGIPTLPAIREQFREKDFNLSKSFHSFRLLTQTITQFKTEIPWYKDVPLDHQPCYHPSAIASVTPGSVLIAHPVTLKSSYFCRSVVLVLHVDDGSVFGVIVNLNSPEGKEKWAKDATKEIAARDNSPWQWVGGPVSHIVIAVFTKKDLLPSAIEIIPGYYYASLHLLSIDQVVGALPKDSYRLYYGLSVWSKPQLQNEIETRNNWLIATVPMEGLFPGGGIVSESGSDVREPVAETRDVAAPVQPAAVGEIPATLASESVEPFVAPSTATATVVESVTEGEATGSSAATAAENETPIPFSFANPTGLYQNETLWNEVLKSQWREKSANSVPTTTGSRTSTRSKEGASQANARIAKESKE